MRSITYPFSCSLVLLIWLMKCDSNILKRNEGESCNFKKNGVVHHGLCRKMTVCYGIYWRTNVDFNVDQMCGFQYEPLVCCPLNATIFGISAWPEPLIRSHRSNFFSMVMNSSSYRVPGDMTKIYLPRAVSKCFEYRQLFCEWTPERSKRSNDDVPVAGGERVIIPGRYAFMAAFGHGHEVAKAVWECGGSVISETWILTAAHCVKTSKGNPTWVKTFEGLNYKGENFYTFFEVSQVVVHPDYRPSAMYHDIALVRIFGDMMFGSFDGLYSEIWPLCLSPLKALPRSVTVAGWGHLSFGGKSSEYLMKVRVKTRDAEACKNIYNNSRWLPQGYKEEMMFCAGDPGKDACTGDSGGPLFYNSDMCRQVQVGIVSFGKQCGMQPTVYTRVSYYIPWIENIVWPSYTLNKLKYAIKHFD